MPPLSRFDQRQLRIGAAACIKTGMSISRRKALTILAAASATAAPARAQTAENFPSKAVRIVYPFAPGGGMEVVLRVIAQEMQKSTGQAFIVDNRTGAPIGFGRAFGRYLLAVVFGAACGLLQLLDSLWPLWDDEKQTLRDKATSAIVVRQRG